MNLDGRDCCGSACTTMAIKRRAWNAPLGDFFAVGHGAERDVNSVMIRDSSFGRARNSYWPMPFRKSCLHHRDQ